MIFCVQASQPRCSGQFDPDEQTLTEAIETAFPLLTEQAVLSWNHILVPLNYKYDFSVIVVDLLALVSKVLRRDSGTYEVQWPSNTFMAHWKVEWSRDVLNITSHWTSTVGNLEAFLNNAGGIRITKEDFVSEWKEPLVQILAALKQCGYQRRQVSGMAALEELIAELPKSGVLYRL